MPVENLGNSFTTATPITLGKFLSGHLENQTDKRYVSFVPTESGSYGFYTEGNCDTYGTLYSSDQTLILKNDNGFKDKNFLVANTLLEGKTYYIGISSTDYHTANSEFKIYVEKYVEPADEHFNQQWYLLDKNMANDINILPVWKQLSGRGVTVGVADTGTDINHEDLLTNHLTNTSYNFIHSIDDVFPADERYSSLSASGGHGTHVAGIIAAANNGTGTVGVAPNASLVSLKVLGSALPNHSMKNDIIASIEAIDYAKEKNIPIVNMSVGGTGYSESEHMAMQKASNILFVIAAGNNGKDMSISGNEIYPASYYLNNSIVVANADQNGKLADRSNYGGMTHVAAPGTNIMSTVPYNNYRSMGGTSMATPVVSGIAALVKEKNPAFTPLQVRNRIIYAGNVTQKSEIGSKVKSGGIVNAFKAVMNEADDRDLFAEDIVDANQRQLMSLSVKGRIKQVKDSADLNSMTEFVILKLNTNIDSDEFLAQVQRDHNFGKIGKINEIASMNCIVIECENNTEASRVVDALNEYSEVIYAEPDYIREIQE